MQRMREWNFDGLVGPTHNYAGLSTGNVASRSNQGRISNPKAAALQGLDKMRFVRDLGVAQAVLAPQSRPNLPFLRCLGFVGSAADVIAQASQIDHGHWLRLACSAASMWTANAATVAPSTDTKDGRLHLVPANLQAMMHRSIEAEQTHRLLSAIFADPHHFCVHPPLPGGGQLADEGAANHTRLWSPGNAAVHLLAWGRSAYNTDIAAPQRFPARQTLESSAALARLLHLSTQATVLHQQDPEGIDAGAFHTDVLAVGNANVLLTHEKAFVDLQSLIAILRSQVPELRVCVASDADLPLADAISSYPFNSQLLSVGEKEMVIVAPIEAEENPRANAYLSRVVSEIDEVKAVHYLDLRQSMSNGGGPACLRLRVPMTDQQSQALGGRVILDEALEADLRAWVERHYRDRLAPEDLLDPQLWKEQRDALDQLAGLLELDGLFAS